MKQINTTYDKGLQKWTFVKSNKTKKHEYNDNPIYLIQQYYIPDNKDRYEEIKFTLKKNVENKYIDKIYLLNERIYTDEELGCSSPKIKQIVIKKRLMISHILTFVDTYELKGYIVFANSDIFLDDSIHNVKYSNIHNEKKLYSQLRIEYKSGIQFQEMKLFDDGCDGYIKSWRNIPGYTPYKSDSADTWIYHTNFSIPKDKRSVFHKYFGFTGIDHIIPMYFYNNGFEIANEPYFIRTYHCHESDYRTWKGTSTQQEKRYKNDDYLLCFPYVGH